MSRIRWHAIRLIVVGALMILIYLVRKWGGIPGLYPLGYFHFSNPERIVPIIPLIVNLGFWFLVAALMLSFLWTIVSVLDDSGKGTPFIRQLAREGIARVIFIEPIRQFSRRLSLGGRLAIWGSVVFIIVVGVGAEGWLDDSDATVARFIRRSPKRIPESTTEILLFVTPDNNVPRYRREMMRMAKDLIDSGARVVVAPMPGAEWDPEQQPLIDSVRANSRIILYEPRYGLKEMDFPPRQEAAKTSLRITMTSKDIIEATPLPEIIRWYPFAAPKPIRNVPPVAGERPNQIDVALPAVAQFLKYPPGTLPQAAAGQVTFGGIKIPVTHQGVAYSPFSWALYRSQLTFIAGYETNDDSLRYSVANGKTAVPILPHSAAQEVSGKIILVDWEYSDPISEDLSRLGRAWAYCQIIESLIQQSFLVKDEKIYLILSLAITALSCYLMSATRLSVAVSVTILMGIATFGFGIVAVRMFHMAIDAGYPLLSSLLCVAILPLVRLAREAR